MSAENQANEANEADKLWARARQAEHEGNLKSAARELLKRAQSVLDSESLKLFGMVLVEGLIEENAFDVAEDLAPELSDDVRDDSQRIVAAARGASAGATEASRRADAKRALTDLAGTGGADLDDQLLDFCKLHQRRGDTVTGEEVLALRRRFNVPLAAREARTPSVANLDRALTEIRSSAT